MNLIAGWFAGPEAQSGIFERFPGLILIPFALVFSAIGSQIYRFFWRSNAAQRQQTKWVVFALAATMASTFWLGSAIQRPAADGQALGTTLMLELGRLAVLNLGFIVVPIAIAVAILRYRLWDIDVIIRRTLIYSVLTAVLALAYFGSVLVLESVFRFLTGQGQNSLGRRCSRPWPSPRCSCRCAPRVQARHRPALLSAKVRRGADPGRLCRGGAGRGGPGSPERSVGGRGARHHAAGASIVVAAAGVAARTRVAPEQSMNAAFLGRLLRLTRLALIAFAIFQLGLVVLGGLLFPDYAVRHVLEFTPNAFWTAGETQAALAELNWPATTLPWFLAVVALIFTLIGMSFGLFLLWRKSDDWFGLYLTFSFLLVSPDFTLIDPVLERVPALTGLVDLLGATGWQIMFMLFYLFPDGRFVPRWTRWMPFVWLGVNLPAWLFFVQSIVGARAGVRDWDRVGIHGHWKPDLSLRPALLAPPTATNQMGGRGAGGRVCVQFCWWAPPPFGRRRRRRSAGLSSGRCFSAPSSGRFFSLFPLPSSSPSCATGCGTLTSSSAAR